MKKISIILILLISTFFSFGQNLSLGSEVGIISSINSDYEVTDFKNRRNTYYSGLNLNYSYDNRLSFTLGLHYLRQGYRHVTCYTFEDGVKNELVGKIDYLSIPISMNVYLLKSRKLIATIGLLGSFNVKAVQDYPKSVGGCAIYYTPDLTNVTRKFSMSAIIGLGYKVFENEHFELIPSIKYYQGLTNMFKSPFQDIPINIDRKYSSILLSINFNYNF